MFVFSNSKHLFPCLKRVPLNGFELSIFKLNNTSHIMNCGTEIKSWSGFKSWFTETNRCKIHNVMMKYAVIFKHWLDVPVSFDFSLQCNLKETMLLVNVLRWKWWMTFILHWNTIALHHEERVYDHLLVWSVLTAECPCPSARPGFMPSNQSSHCWLSTMNSLWLCMLIFPSLHTKCSLSGAHDADGFLPTSFMIISRMDETRAFL